MNETTPNYDNNERGRHSSQSSVIPGLATILSFYFKTFFHVPTLLLSPSQGVSRNCSASVVNQVVGDENRDVQPTNDLNVALSRWTDGNNHDH